MGMDPIVFLLITLLLYGNGSYSVSINNFTLIWEWIL